MAPKCYLRSWSIHLMAKPHSPFFIIKICSDFRVIASHCTNMQFAWLCTIRWHCLWQSAEPFVAGCPSFIQCCVHCCELRMSHVSLSFQLPSLSGHVVSSQSSFIDHRPMFVLVSLFLVCLPVFLLLFSLADRNTAGIIE